MLGLGHDLADFRFVVQPEMARAARLAGPETAGFTLNCPRRVGKLPASSVAAASTVFTRAQAGRAAVKGLLALGRV